MKENGTVKKRESKEGGYSCPLCKQPMGVIDSRPGAGSSIRRRRECTSCQHRVTTYETQYDVTPEIVQALSQLELSAGVLGGAIDAHVSEIRSLRRAYEIIEDLRFNTRARSAHT